MLGLDSIVGCVIHYARGGAKWVRYFVGNKLPTLRWPTKLRLNIPIRGIRPPGQSPVPKRHPAPQKSLGSQVWEDPGANRFLFKLNIFQLNSYCPKTTFNLVKTSLLGYY